MGVYCMCYNHKWSVDKTNYVLNCLQSSWISQFHRLRELVLDTCRTHGRTIQAVPLRAQQGPGEICSVPSQTYVSPDFFSPTFFHWQSQKKNLFVPQNSVYTDTVCLRTLMLTLLFYSIKDTAMEPVYDSWSLWNVSQHLISFGL